MQQRLAQSFAIDALKATGSQLIVLHHLSAYGPIAEALGAAAPQAAGWLYEYARMAVQIFLVVGGFLAAHALSSGARTPPRFPIRAILARYLRLAVPYLAALVLAIAAAALARPWFDGDFVPAPAQPRQLLSHALLANQWLGHEALSAGVWYVAIDFQLFATFAVLLWLGRTLQRDAPGRPGRAGVQPLALLPIAACAIASLFWFNRNPGLDDWSIYFFGAYAMGAFVYWARRARHPRRWVAVVTLVAIAALALDFRWRLAVALGTALVLAASGLSDRTGARASRPIGYLSGISYALFLVHFPVILATSALLASIGWRSPAAGLWGALFAWAASLAVADGLHRWIERPAAKLYRRLAA